MRLQFRWQLSSSRHTWRFSVTKKCATCGKVFHRPKRYSNKKWSDRRFCAKTCVRPEPKPLGPKTPYRQSKRAGVHRGAHRQIMEEHLGRKLGRFELVHHRNGNKTDNRIENLEVVTPKTHSMIHQQKYPLTKFCEVCGVEFTPHPTKRARAKTCSKDCRYTLLSRIHRNPDAPRSMYRATATPSEAARRSCRKSRRRSSKPTPTPEKSPASSSPRPRSA